MRVHFDISALRKTRWYEYAVRFLFGGAITAATGLVAKHFGPVVGGLFLAFPAIFPASVTLVAKHEKEKKQKVGMDGTARAKKAAALDARGAAMGTLGLGFFALVVWKLLPVWNWVAVLSFAILACRFNFNLEHGTAPISLVTLAAVLPASTWPSTVNTLG